MFNFDFSVHAFWWTPLASSVCLIVNNRLTEKCQFKILQKWTPTSWIPLR